MSSRFGTARGDVACAAALICSLTACASTTQGATEADLARAREKASQGAAVFSQECGHCHGQRGEGLSGALAVLGPGALPEYPRDASASGNPAMTDPQQLQIQIQTRPAGAPRRDPFRNAGNLYEFTRGHLPKERASGLKPDDYWALVNFMLAVQGSELPPGGVNASNATSIPIPRR